MFINKRSIKNMDNLIFLSRFTFIIMCAIITIVILNINNISNIFLKIGVLVIVIGAIASIVNSRISNNRILGIIVLIPLLNTFFLTPIINIYIKYCRAFAEFILENEPDNLTTKVNNLLVFEDREPIFTISIAIAVIAIVTYISMSIYYKSRDKKVEYKYIKFWISYLCLMVLYYYVIGEMIIKSNIIIHNHYELTYFIIIGIAVAVFYLYAFVKESIKKENESVIEKQKDLLSEINEKQDQGRCFVNKKDISKNSYKELIEKGVIDIVFIDGISIQTKDEIAISINKRYIDYIRKMTE